MQKNKFNRVLFVGNSITLHQPAPDIGWFGNWGMAASLKERDYVHLLMERLTANNPEIVFHVKNVADFERSFSDFELESFKEMQEFSADIIIMRIAENVNDEEAGKSNFGQHYSQLIHYLDPGKAAIVICTNSFWSNTNINHQIKMVSDENSYIFVDIGDLFEDKKNAAIDKFEHEGVGVHPSDIGMEKIAGRIWNKVNILLKAVE